LTPNNDPAWLRLLPKILRQHVTGRFHLHAAIHNSGWLLFEKLARVLLGLFVGAWVARYLGPGQYGQLAYVLAYLAFFQVIVSLGLDGIVVREISLHRDHAAQILGTAFALRLGCGVVAWVLAVVGLMLLNGWDDISVLMALLAGSALVFQSADTVDLWFQSQSQSRRTVMAKLTAYLISNAIKIVLILSQAPTIAFAGVFALDAGAAAVGVYIAYKRYTCDAPWKLASVQARKLLKESWPFILSGLSIMVYTRIDQIMIKEMLGEAELGIYAAVLPLSTYWQVIPMTLSISLAPYIAKQRMVSDAQYRRSIVLIFRGFFCLGLFAFLFTYSVSNWVIPLLYGSRYVDAIRILDVHALSNMFCFLGIAHGLWLTNERRFAVRLYGTMLAGGGAVLTNILLLPKLGLIGACYSAIFAQAIAAFLINALFDRAGFRLQIEAITFKRI
jgi:O-antigen/teichoic acid export membrane protein